MNLCSSFKCCFVRSFARLLARHNIADFRYALCKNTNDKNFDSASGIDYGGMQIANARMYLHQYAKIMWDNRVAFVQWCERWTNPNGFFEKCFVYITFWRLWHCMVNGRIKQFIWTIWTICNRFPIGCTQMKAKWWHAHPWTFTKLIYHKCIHRFNGFKRFFNSKMKYKLLSLLVLSLHRLIECLNKMS